MSYDDYNNEYKSVSKYESDGYEPVSVIGWIGIMLLLAIPFLNIITLLVMAFGMDNKNLKNFAIAALILFAIPITLAILFRGCYIY